MKNPQNIPEEAIFARHYSQRWDYLFRSLDIAS